MRFAALAEVAEINPRVTSRPNDEDYISFLRMADLDAVAGKTNLGQIRQFREVSKGYTLFLDQDILVAKITPCFENNKIGLAHLSRPIGVGSTEFHVVRARADSLDRRYLLHFLRRKRIRVDGERRMTGSAGQRRVPAAYLEELRLPLPPIHEQRRISVTLDRVDALLAKRQQVVAYLDDFGQSLFAETFNAAEGLLTRPLSELAVIASGLTKGRRLNGLPTRKVPYLAVANVQDGHLRLDKVKEIDATEDEISRFALQEGDLVLTEGGDPDKLGRGTLWRGELPLMLHQNHIFRVRTTAGGVVLPEYLSAFMSSLKARNYFLRAAKQTTGIASINLTQLKALPVAVPSLPLQIVFIRQLEDSRHLRRQGLEHAYYLGELRDALLQRAFVDLL